MGKITVIYVTFLCDVACQKLLNSANVSRSYTQNNTGTVFLRHGVFIPPCDDVGLLGKGQIDETCDILIPNELKNAEHLTVRLGLQ